MVCVLQASRFLLLGTERTKRAAARALIVPKARIDCAVFLNFSHDSTQIRPKDKKNGTHVQSSQNT